MSIHRIGETQAKPETTEAMSDFLISIIPLYIANLCYKIVMYALIAGEYCTGTGTGETRFVRLCDETSLIIPLIVDLLLLVGLATWIAPSIGGTNVRKYAKMSYSVYCLLGPLIWNCPFFLTRVH